jgi:hypothetical protein
MKKGTGVELDPADALRRAAAHKPPMSSTSHKSIPAIPANRMLRVSFATELGRPRHVRVTPGSDRTGL